MAVMLIFLSYKNTDESDNATSILLRLLEENTLHKYIIYTTIKMNYQIIYSYFTRKLKGS